MPHDELVYFDTPRNAELFESARVKDHFWSICRHFVSEKFMTYCGVATGATLLNSLDVPAPEAPQIYPYRIFTQENIFTEDVLPIRRPHDVERDGNTLDQLADVLKVFVDVEVVHADAINLDGFRSLAVETLRSPNRRVAVDFDRATLGQKGSGHFSPLAAYDEQTDRFLLMDVARYKLPPAWITARDLWNAINTVDPVSSKHRGVLVLTKRPIHNKETV